MKCVTCEREMDGVKVYHAFGTDHCRMCDLLAAESAPALCGNQSAIWPMKSEALAVHPNQVAEANERNRKAGVSVTYEPGTGLAVIPSPHERRKLMKLEGVHDRRSFC